MNKEYSNLDLLRSFAVLSVVLCHLGNFFEWDKRLQTLGVLGVTLFFVHTSIVLMQSLERQRQDNLYMPFLIRRFFRIYPVAIFATCCVILFHIPQGAIRTGTILPIHYNGIDIAYNLTLATRFFRYVPSILMPEWSLSYEVEMYLTLPALYILIRNCRSFRVPIVYSGLLAISFLLCVYYPYETRLSFLSIFGFVPCFAAGIVAYHLQKEVTPKFSAGYWPLLLILLTAALAGDAIIGVLGKYQWWVAAATVGFSAPYFKQVASPFFVQAFKLIARYSYGIYLSHYLSIWVAFEKMSGYSLIAQIAVFSFMLTAIPVVLYHAIEKPFIDLGKKTTEPRPANALHISWFRARLMHTQQRTE